MMEKKGPKGFTVLGVIAIILNTLFLSPFALLLGIPVESDKLLKIPLAAIPLVLTFLGIFCGVNLIRRTRLRLILVIVKTTIIYYFLLIIFAITAKYPDDLIILISFPIILNVVILSIVHRPQVKEQFK